MKPDVFYEQPRRYEHFVTKEGQSLKKETEERGRARAADPENQVKQTFHIQV